MSGSPRVIAFFLPQFHEIVENNMWWGDGFSDWTNTRAARPLFDEHDHPRRPLDDHYYDLTSIAELKRQSAQARDSGIDAFCLYFYWFDSRRLLEQPLDLYKDLPDELPFCLSWANENWTRRWDGKDDEVLMGQHYGHDTPAQVYDAFRSYFAAPHYLKHEGKPVLLVHRVDHLPDPSRYVSEWRRQAVRDGWPGLHIVAAETRKGLDPRPMGLDAVAEFPPVGRNGLAHVSLRSPRSLDRRFSGRLLSYAKIAASSSARREPNFTRYRGVMPGWDNTARRGSFATIYLGHSPERYQWWMERAMLHEKRRRGERGYVFINAWNEWAEGAYLQPDVGHGMRYLEATKRVTQMFRSGAEPDATPLPTIGDPPYAAGLKVRHLRAAAFSALTSGAGFLRSARSLVQERVSMSDHAFPDSRLLVESLRIGDHTNLLGHPAKSVLGLLMLVLAVARGLRHPRRRKAADVVLAISSPVAHGAALAKAASSALGHQSSFTWCDLRLNQGLGQPLVDFPSLSPISLLQAGVRPSDLTWGWRLVRLGYPRRESTLPASHAFTWAYLLAAQGVRYRMALRDLGEVRPLVLISDMDRNSGCAPIVLAARAKGIRTATLVHGSPNSNYLPVLSHDVLCWSDLQARWFSDRSSAIPHVVGRLSSAVAPPHSDNTDLVILHSCEVLSHSELAGLKRAITEASSDGLATVLRLHPNTQVLDEGDEWSSIQELCDVTMNASDASDWLGQCHTAVAVSSTAIIDAVGAGRRALIVADPSRVLPCELSHLRATHNGRGGKPHSQNGEELRQVILPFVNSEAKTMFHDYVTREVSLWSPPHSPQLWR